jgi:tetratricopeptide (TPR) repeat protein
MDIENPVIKLCLAGTKNEYLGHLQMACEAYQQAWELAQDDYEACIAAHYLARCQSTEEKILHWNLSALDHALQVNDNRIKPFLGSLYVNLGQSYERLHDQIKADKYYLLAAEHGIIH